VQKAQIDAQSSTDKAQIDAASAEQIARIKQETELQIAELKARFDAMEAAMQREHSLMTQPVGMAGPAAPDLMFRGESDLPLDQV